jgi:hypothetical protein
MYIYIYICVCVCVCVYVTNHILYTSQKMTIPNNYQPKYENKVTYRQMKSIYNSVSLRVRPPQPVAREQHVARDVVFVMLPAQMFEMRKCFLILSLSKQKQTVEAILKNYELHVFIYG